MSKPVIHGRDHGHGGADVVRIAWEDVGGGGSGGGGGIVFDTSPQTGGFFELNTSGQNGAFGIRLLADVGTFSINAASEDVEVTATRNVELNAGQELSAVSGADLTASASGDLWLSATGDVYVNHDGLLKMPDLPSADPGVSGALWRDASGFLRVSA